MKFEDFEIDMCYVVTKGNGTFEEGDHIWVDSVTGIGINCAEAMGCLDKEDAEQGLRGMECKPCDEYVVVNTLRSYSSGTSIRRAEKP